MKRSEEREELLLGDLRYTEGALLEQNNQNRQLQQEVEDLQRDGRSQDQNTITTLRERTACLEAQLRGKEAELQDKNTQLAKKNEWMDVMDLGLIQKDEDLEELREKVREMKDLEAWVLCEYKEFHEPSPASPQYKKVRLQEIGWEDPKDDP